MAKPERVLRLTGSYFRTEGLSEEEFYNFMSRRHGVECAKIHKKYDVLKYQMGGFPLCTPGLLIIWSSNTKLQTFNTASTQALLHSLKLPYVIDSHDLQIEYFFRDVSALLAVSSDEDFKALHVEAAPYVRLDDTTANLSWVEVYLEDGKLVNIGTDGQSLQPSFAEQSNVQVSDKPADKYY